MSGASELHDSTHAGQSARLTPQQQRSAAVSIADRALREGWDRSLLTEQLDMLGLLQAHPVEVAS